MTHFPSTAGDGTPVELWYSHRGGATTSALALRQHWLQDEFAQGGTLLRSLSEAASRDIRLSHYHHGQSGLLREGSNVPAIWARAAGQHAVVVGVTWVAEYQGILTLAGGKLRELADLKGKRLGLPLRRRALIDLQRASALRGFTSALQIAGLPHATARWVHVESPDFEYPQRTPGREIELAALRSGYVDAVFLRGAQGYTAAQDPRFHQLADLNAQADPLLRTNSGTPRTITVDAPFLARHPDIVARYLAVLLRTARWAAGNPAQVADAVARETPDYIPAHVLGAHGADLHTAFTPALDAERIAALAAQKRFLLDWGFLAGDFDMQDWIDPAPLRRAAEFLAQRERADGVATLAHARPRWPAAARHAR